MKYAASIFVCILFIFSGTAFAGSKKVITILGGTPIPGFGLTIDASYDSSLDKLVPKYRVLNVAIVNNSFNIIQMDPEKDEWWIKTKGGRKKYLAISDLRSKDAEAWHSMPDHARDLIAYPLLLPIGARQVIDLFLPEDIPIEKFDELIIHIGSLGVTFKILARQ